MLSEIFFLTLFPFITHCDSFHIFLKERRYQGLIMQLLKTRNLDSSQPSYNYVLNKYP